MRKAIVSLALALVTAVAFALPTTQEVEAQVRQGNYSQAEAMMNEVVTARPGSARAHYVYAEILAHNRNYAKAADEAQKARQIDPALSFTDPAKFRAFEQLLAREQSASKSSSGSLNIGPSGTSTDRAAPARAAPTREAPVRESTGAPGWLWGLGAIALAWVAWRMMAKRRAAGAAGMAAGPAGATAYGPMNPNAGGPYGPGNAYGPGQPVGPAAMGRPGSGMLGTGMAVAGGVAGGMLLNEMLNRRHDGGATGNTAQGGSDGLVPGSFDTGDAQVAANELQSRDVDFGSGNDWGGDAGSIDVGDAGGSGDDWG